MGELQRLICAVQFLTRLPTPALADFPSDAVSRAARYFPLVGQLVGGLCALALLAGSQVWTGALPALVAVALGVLITGAFHEDGLADTADGLGGGGDPVRRLEIMKDSRIGTYGALALGLVLAIKVAALAQLAPAAAALALLGAHGAARACAVVVMRVYPYVGDLDRAKWKPTPMSVRPLELAVALGIAAWPLLLMGAPEAVAGLALASTLAIALAHLARRLLGGYTGDVLGAVEQVFETGFLLGVALVL